MHVVSVIYCRGQQAPTSKTDVFFANGSRHFVKGDYSDFFLSNYNKSLQQLCPIDHNLPYIIATSQAVLFLQIWSVQKFHWSLCLSWFSHTVLKDSFFIYSLHNRVVSKLKVSNQHKICFPISILFYKITKHISRNEYNYLIFTFLLFY